MTTMPGLLIPLGLKAPKFSTLDVLSGNILQLQDVRGDKGTVVMFICNECPFVVHLKDELTRVANDYRKVGIGFVAINSNDVQASPEDSPENMVQFAHEAQFPFPYLYDESQEIARAYGALCTPDLRVYDDEMNCVYFGQFDDSRPGNEKPVNGADLRQALDAIVAGEPMPEKQKPGIGCNIIWKQ